MNELNSISTASQQSLRDRQMEELIAERDRLSSVLSDYEAGRLLPKDLPSDAHLYYGRLRAVTRTIEGSSLADDLIAYAQFVEGLDRQHTAETLIARRFARDLRSGHLHIDLSQCYATEDSSMARARHDIALVRLDEFISRAERVGYHIECGEAIAAALKHTQVMAIASGFGA
ncbi:MAG: hypothetical protein WB992_05695 [Bryobacteraceae bacterium]